MEKNPLSSKRGYSSFSSYHKYTFLCNRRIGYTGIGVWAHLDLVRSGDVLARGNYLSPKCGSVEIER